MNTYEYMHRNTAGLHYNGLSKEGNKITIDAAEYSPGHFVVVVLNASGKELDHHEAHSLDEAKKIYNDLFRSNADPEDVGACNTDRVSLMLPRWRTAKVEQAAAEAGTGCFKIWAGQFNFWPNTRSQGSPRTRNAEAMTAALRSMGYDARTYYQVD